jgi:hypothetical protein
MAFNRSETNPGSLNPTPGRTAARKSQVNQAGNKTIFVLPVKVYQAEGLQDLPPCDSSFQKGFLVCYC